MPVFDNIKYHLPLSLPSDRRNELSSVLDINGARLVSLDRATHVITNSSQFEGWQDIADGVFVISDKWVDRSIIMGKSQPFVFLFASTNICKDLTVNWYREQYYSADPAMIFSGIVACATDLPATDLEVLSAGITALGGQWRGGLTRDVTHLFALSPESDKYNTAMHFKDQTKMIVLLPHWFDDAVRLGFGTLPTAEYEWPDPRILKPSSELVLSDSDAAKKLKKISSEKRSLYKSALMTPGKDASSVSPSRDVWQKRRILLSPSLELSGGRREAVEAGIRRANGVVVEFEAQGGDGDIEEEFRKVDETDILITRYRSGVPYFRAARAGKTIGTLSWLFHVESSGTMSRPTDQLLHYPIPKRLIEGFASHEITITNYTGDSRDYLKRLISAMGAKFTPSMSTSNTIVIAAYISGNKTTKARSWSIPVVNHTWLEDCFVQWKNLTVGLEKYIVFPHGVDFAQILGEKGVGKVILEDMDIDIEEDLEAEAAAKYAVPKSTSLEKGNGLSKPPAHEHLGETETSAKDAREVEEVVALPDDDGDVVMRSEPTREVTKSSKKGKKRKEDAMDIDDNEDEARPPSPKPRSRKPRVSSAKKKIPAAAGDGADEPREEEDGVSAKKPRRKLIRRAGQMRNSGNMLDAEHIESTDEPGPSSKAKPSERNADNDESSGQDLRPIVHKLTQTTIRQPEQTQTEDEESDHDAERLASSPLKGKARDNAKKPTGSPQKLQTPKRTVSVLVPSLPKDYPSVSNSAKKNSNLGRTDSLRVEADEAAVGLSPKRGRPSKRPCEEIPEHGVTETPRHGGGIHETPSTLARSLSKRSAASKASTRLRNEIMPDVVNFERERKHAKSKDKDRAAGEKRKKRASDAADLDQSSEGEEEVQNNKRQRVETNETQRKQRKGGDEEVIQVAKPPKSAKQTRVAVESEDESSGEDEQITSKKKATVSTKPPNPKGAGIENQGKSRGSEAKVIKMMTTQISLSDDVIKRLGKLGVKTTTRPNECTHLLTKNIVRTEKFLCAMAVSPYVLNEKWATASAAANQLLPEDKYILSDPEAEKKWGFNLTDALRRSKDHGCGLFAQMTFYMTAKVPIDHKLLKNIVAAAGGQISTQAPTSRILKAKEGRYVISCPEDASIWRPLVRDGHPIYSPELILKSVLTQEIDWKDTANKVQGTY
ncbi:hypothetical protein SERLA73DRAFT_161344 [Serpula lacrymans var. lacrymans S7.3]|uniref:BRCT domain-containing protein n=1 Tax=Serpula lacrymans var. lacrymans (strain S7.3) TaxID=936435 RepID=F8Q1V2_SERL3|nr:hypothetical protein SERLA73DRAFT_161344 [Serpula lacrymans var. lacrymans S7.3]